MLVRLQSKVFSYHSLVALCLIFVIYHIGSIGSMRSRLAAHIQDTTTSPEYSGIPKIIWYKLGPHGLSEDARTWTDSCINANPEYEAHFMTDESGDAFVRETFAWRPDIVTNYLALSVPIWKADILRYLLLWDQGGIWFDLDVSCENIPIDEWIPTEYQNDTALVVGWEFDHGWPGRYMHQMEIWAIMAKPRSPHLMQVIDDILQVLEEKTTELGIPVENATMDMMGDTVEFTGPRRLTSGVYKSLGNMLNRSLEGSDVEELLQPKLVGDVLVMPGSSFALSSNIYTPEEEAQLSPALVEHHYAGTWKNSHGGED
jgi:alpha 1,6-mannosyltransferase